MINNKHTDMKIYRAIASDTINTEQLGASWTLCEVFAEKRAKEMATVNDSGNWVVISAEVNEDDVDWDATLAQFKSDYFDTEFEVVLNNYVDVDFEVVYSEGDFEDGSGSTGNNEPDETMSELEDDEDIESLKAEFIEIANEF